MGPRTPYKGRRVFRTSAGYMLVFVAAELIFLVGAVYTYRARGWTWTSAALIALTVLGLAGRSPLRYRKTRRPLPALQPSTYLYSARSCPPDPCFPHPRPSPW
ncbi:MAG TPA: hypothetical protein VGQ24_01985 [Gemmatimonadales bacterium]|jgi:hypothetical protein|nr:hypothetical protein [Gemmatimonadales bacterium]